jgi:hypothetical protein
VSDAVAKMQHGCDPLFMQKLTSGARADLQAAVAAVEE